MIKEGFHPDQLSPTRSSSGIREGAGEEDAEKILRVVQEPLVGWARVDPDPSAHCVAAGGRAPHPLRGLWYPLGPPEAK